MEAKEVQIGDRVWFASRSAISDGIVKGVYNDFVNLSSSRYGMMMVARADCFRGADEAKARLVEKIDVEINRWNAIRRSIVGE